jgi:hypothetical protein
MPRYILIDNNSGYIFGDSADFAAGNQSDLTPTEAARLMDESIGEHGREYRELSCMSRDTRTGYAVYRADINGSEAVPVVQDGQDREMIEAVERDCEFVAFVEVA